MSVFLTFIALSVRAFVPSLDARWDVVSVSNAGDATALRHVDEDGFWLPDEFPLEYHCEGNPPSFEILFHARDESPAWTRGFEGEAGGSIRLHGRTIRQAVWRGWGYRSFATSLHRAEIDALVESSGDLDLEIHGPDGDSVRYRSEETGVSQVLFRRFLQQCGRHVQRANRRFEIDGIQVDLRLEVDDRELRDLRALAAEVGVRDIESIYVGLDGIPVPLLSAKIQSREERVGNRIAQSLLYLSHENWPSSWVDREEPLLTRGSWQTSARNLHNRDRWIVRDGDWSIEVHLHELVPYDDAVRIIRAIRTGELVDVREGPSWGHLAVPSGLGAFDRDRFPSIRVIDGDDRWYEVNLPRSRASGTSIEVRIVDDRVEVRSVAMWIV